MPCTSRRSKWTWCTCVVYCSSQRRHSTETLAKVQRLWSARLSCQGSNWSLLKLPLLSQTSWGKHETVCLVLEVSGPSRKPWSFPRQQHRLQHPRSYWSVLPAKAHLAACFPSVLLLPEPHTWEHWSSRNLKANLCAYQSWFSSHWARYCLISIGKLSSYSWWTCSKNLESSCCSWYHWVILRRRGWKKKISVNV